MLVVGMWAQHCPNPFPPQGCRIYLCGTKSDLLEEDRRKRGVDFHDVQDYADGTAGAGSFQAHGH